MTYIARAATIGCFLWMLSFVLFGGSQSGRDFFGNLVTNSMADPKGGIPLLMLAMPVLLSGTMCSLLVLRSPPDVNNRRFVLRGCPLWAHRLFQSWTSGNGERNFEMYSVIFIIVPSFIYMASSIHRHMYKSEKDATESVKETGNSCGMMAMIALSFFLVPVSKHGPILKLLGWSPVQAIRLHIWCGRLIVAGSLAHGAMHLYRWKHLLGEGLWSILIPPTSCWTVTERDFQPQCNNPDTECSCYHHFRNFSGLIAGVLLVVIAITSMAAVRRKFYSAFYMSHILAAPTVLIAIIMHYDRAILYIAPSILYYTATTLPPFVEQWTNRKNGGVKLLSVEHIASAEKGGRSCVSLTFEASNLAAKCFRPGLYVNLMAPEISNISHPFTVNKVPGRSKQMRIIFRELGSFTKDLSSHLCSGNWPLIQIDGYHGSPERLSQILQHDVAILVCGGIGITPMLSLLDEMTCLLSCLRSSTRSVTARVELHWICRDPSLIDYVNREHFEPLMQSTSSTSCAIDIVIHSTRDKSELSLPSSANILHANVSIQTARNDGEARQIHTFADSSSAGSPFSPSKFSSGRLEHVGGNLESFVAFSLIAWLGLTIIWFVYTYLQRDDQLWQRSLSPIAVLILGVLVSSFANVSKSFARGYSSIGAVKCWGKVNSDHVDTVPDSENMPLNAGSSSRCTYDSSSSDEEEPMGSVSLRIVTGRPTVDSILNGFEGSLRPGVFCCGPTSLSREIHTSALKLCTLRAQRESPGTPHIAVYDEEFLM